MVQFTFGQNLQNIGFDHQKTNLKESLPFETTTIKPLLYFKN